MITWAVAWASVRHKEPGMMSLTIFTMCADVAIFAALTAPFWAQHT